MIDIFMVILVGTLAFTIGKNVGYDEGFDDAIDKEHLWQKKNY